MFAALRGDREAEQEPQGSGTPGRSASSSASRRSSSGRNVIRAARLSGKSFRELVQAHSARRTIRRQPDPQRVVVRDHLLRALPRPDVHLHSGGDRGGDPWRLVRAPAHRRGEHRWWSAVPRDQREPPAIRSSTPVPRTCRERATGEIAPKVREICERYELPYNSGRFGKQWYTVHRTIFRLAFPGGTAARRSPGPYRSPGRAPGRAAGRERGAAVPRAGCPPNTRPRAPSTSPAASAVEPPARGND